MKIGHNDVKWRHMTSFSIYFPYMLPKNTRCVHNFCLHDAIVFMFAPQLNIIKRNLSWRFGRDLIRWRHFMSSYIPPLPMGGVVPHFPVADVCAPTLEFSSLKCLQRIMTHISKRFNSKLNAFGDKLSLKKSAVLHPPHWYANH